MVDLALGVRVRDLVLAKQRRHARIAERQPPGGVVQRRPDHVRRVRSAGGLGDVHSLLLLALHRGRFGIVGHAEHAVRALEGGGQTGGVVQVGRHDLGAPRRERPRLVRARIAGDRPAGESAIGIAQDRLAQARALRSRRADNRDDPVTGQVGLSKSRTSSHRETRRQAPPVPQPQARGRPQSSIA